MKNIYKPINLLLLYSLLFTSCVYHTIESDASAKYLFNPNNTSVQWTAYKFTSKFGVSGKIDGFKFTPNKNFATNSEGIKSIIKNMRFEVEPNLIAQESNTKNANIQTYFFDKLNSKKIFGKIINVDLGSEVGIATIELNFNNISKKLNANYYISDNKIEIKTTLNLADFSALNALDSLNKKCYDLHKGADNISMTWPDVDIKVVSTLEKAKEN